MSLLVYNLTAAPLVLANGLGTTIPASTVTPGPGLRGLPWYASGNELQGRSNAEYLALQAQADAGLVAFVWPEYQEYPTPGLSVLASETFFANEDFLIWVGPAGVAGAAGTAAAPTTIPDAFARLPNTWSKRCQMNFLPGNYAPTSIPLNCGKQSNAPTASPFVMIGGFTNEQGDRTSTASDANGRNITDAGLAGVLTLNTTLTDNPLSSSATTVNVVSTAGFPTQGFIQIDSEIIAYSGLTATSFTGCQRGAGAGAVSHLVGATVSMESRYRGYYISIIVAGNVQQRRMIVSNTAGGQFNVNAKFSPVPAAGAIFRIEAPSAVVDMTVAGGTVAFPKAGNWGMKGIAWVSTSGASFNLAEQSNCISAEGIWFKGSSAALRPLTGMFRGSHINGQSFPPPWTPDGVNNPFDFARSPAGLYYKYVQPAVQFSRADAMNMILDSCNFSFTENAQGSLGPVFSRFSTISFARSAVLNNWNNDATANPVTSLMDVGDGQNQIIQCGATSALRGPTGALQLNNSNVSAVLIAANGMAQGFGSNSGTISISGTGNLRYGVEITSGGELQLVNQSITLTGTLGDLKVGNKAVMTWAQFRARYPLASAPNNYASDFVPPAPFKKVFTGLVAADSFDITAAPMNSSPILTVGTLRVVGGAAAAIGSYATTDVGGTPLSPAAGTVVGLATVSDDGKTIVFPAGSLVTDFTIEYVPVDPVSAMGARARNDSV